MDSSAESLWAVKKQEQLHGRKIDRLVQAQRAPTKKALELQRFKRVSWLVAADKLRCRFQRAADEAHEATPWERLYVHQDDTVRSVRLYYGRHPVPGILEKDVETGASLVVSQDSLGRVFVLFFPFESKNVRQRKVKLVWAHYDEPQRIHESDIRRMLRDFFTYGRATSALMSPARSDYRRLARLEHRSRLFEGGAQNSGLRSAATGVLIVGSIATAAIIVAWIVADKSSLEPWAGLVALATGWIAAWVQRSQENNERLLSKAIDTEMEERADLDRRSSEKKLPDE